MSLGIAIISEYQNFMLMAGDSRACYEIDGHYYIADDESNKLQVVNKNVVFGCGARNLVYETMEELRMGNTDISSLLIKEGAKSRSSYFFIAGFKNGIPLLCTYESTNNYKPDLTPLMPNSIIYEAIGNKSREAVLCLRNYFNNSRSVYWRNKESSGYYEKALVKLIIRTYNKLSDESMGGYLTVYKIDKNGLIETLVDRRRIKDKQGLLYYKRDCDIEHFCSLGKQERGFSANTRTDQNNPDELRQSFSEQPLEYEQLSNKTTMERTQKIYDKGLPQATQELYSSMGKGEFKPEMVVLSKMLARDYAAKGDMNSARNVLSATAERLTIAGQFSQAARLLRDADPETFIMTIDKQLKKLNEQGEKQYGKKWTPIDLLPEELDTIKAIPKGDEVAYQETWKKIGQRIAQQLPSTNMEKFDAWRRIAMLFNPRTHVRNIGGNLLMSGMQRASDIVGATIEGVFLPKEQRTKSFGWKSDSNLVQKVNEAWQADKETLTNQSRYEINNLKALGQDKRIFKSNALQGLNDITMQGLNLGDIPFVQAAYKNSLGQFMKARGLTEVTQEAKDYAKRRALEATFKETNEMATIINRLKQKPVVGKIIEGAIPFSKTPANITMRAIDYSPGGLLKALYDAKTGKTAVKTIEDLSKGLTGTAIMALGVWLSKIGWARVERDRSEKAEGLYQEMGRQSNSIITPKGSYTFDWAQPFAVPLAIGVTVGETMSKREDGDSLTSALIEGLYAGGDTIFNMTMLRNIKDIFGSGGSPTKKILSIPVSYIEQAIPAIFGQAARTIDPVRRSTYDPDPMRQEWNRIKSRVPFASKSLEPYLNIWGEEQQQGGAVEQFISPGYWNSQSGDRVTNEIMRVHKATGDNSILPKIAFNFQLDGKTVSLPSDLMTEFQREMGQRNHSDLLALIGSSRYQKADDESRGKLIREVVEKNYNDVKKNIIKEYKLIQASAFKQ